MRKVKALHKSMQVKHVYESYFLLEENHFLSDFQRYIFDSLLQHPLTRDTTFAYIRSCVKNICKQNRSTEGCSKLKRSEDVTSSGKNGLNIRTNASPKWDRTRCPDE